MTPDAPEVPKVLAVWTGPQEVQSPEHGLLIPGETEALIGAHEAIASTNWAPVDPVTIPDPIADEIAVQVKALVDANKLEELQAAAGELSLDVKGTKTEIATAIVAAQGVNS